MSYQLYSDEERRLQRKLIPLNLIIAIIALVAAISLLITPLIKINLGAIMSAVSGVAGEGTAGSENVEDGSGENGANGEESSKSPYAIIFEQVDAELAFAPLDMAKVLFAPNDEKGMLLVDKFFIENGLLEEVAVSAINLTIASQTDAIGSESDFDKLDITALNAELKKLDNIKDAGEMVTALDGYLTLLESQLDVTLSAEEKQAAKQNCIDLYYDTVEATGGEFSVEKMICVNMSPEGSTYLTYSDLAKGMLNGELSSGEDKTDTLMDISDTVNMIAAPYGYMFLFVLFHVLMWFILFLFAFFRTFSKNKRFTMWYVKLVSCWPCIIFFLLPFAMTKAAGSVAVIAEFAGIFAAITSMTWISGICYLVLWALSICWAFPIKHKIRKLRKGK